MCLKITGDLLSESSFVLQGVSCIIAEERENLAYAYVQHSMLGRCSGGCWDCESTSPCSIGLHAPHICIKIAVQEWLYLRLALPELSADRCTQLSCLLKLIC